MAIIRIPQWLAKDRNLARELDVVVTRETQKAILVNGTIRVGPSISCARCARTLTNPVSRVVGIGPECCEHWGIPRPLYEDAKKLDDALRVATRFENMWIPKSQIELLEGDLTAEAAPPKAATVEEPTHWIKYIDGELRLRVPFDERSQAKKIFGQKGWDNVNKAWKLLDDQFVIAQVRQMWPEIDFSQVQKDEATIERVHDENLYDYQKDGVDFLLNAKRALLGDDMGLGKTIELLKVSQASNAKHTLVLCPAYLKWNWEKECKKWWPEATIQLVDGDADEREAQLASGARVTIANFESFFRMGMVFDKKLGKEVSAKVPIKSLESMKWDVLIIDEAHRIKGRDTKTFKMVKVLARNSTYVFPATGTPILNNASELWPLLHVMYPKVFRGYWKYAETFCDVFNNGYGTEVLDVKDPDDERILHLRAILEPIMIRRTKAEVFPDMPKKIVQRFYVDLDPKQAEQYTDMEEAMMAEVGDEVVFAPMALAQLTRLKQICIDPRLMLDPDTEPLAGPKVRAALEYIHDLGDKKVVIFSQWSRVINRFQKTLDLDGISSAKITGEVPNEERARIVEDFHTSDGPRVLLCTIKAGGVGINLQCASTAIFFDEDWTPKINEQAQDRLHRHGQKETVNIVILTARNTVELNIAGVLREKLKVSDIIIERRN